MKNKSAELKMPKPTVGEIRMFPPEDDFEAAHLEEWTVQRYCRNGRWQTCYGKEREKAIAEYEKQERALKLASEVRTERELLQDVLDWADRILEKKIEKYRAARKKEKTSKKSA